MKCQGRLAARAFLALAASIFDDNDVITEYRHYWPLGCYKSKGHALTDIWNTANEALVVLHVQVPVLNRCAQDSGSDGSH